MLGEKEDKEREEGSRKGGEGDSGAGRCCMALEAHPALTLPLTMLAYRLGVKVSCPWTEAYVPQLLFYTYALVPTKLTHTECRLVRCIYHCSDHNLLYHTSVVSGYT